MPNRICSVLGLGLLISLTAGCASIQRLTSSDHMSDKDRLEANAKNQDEALRKLREANRVEEQKHQYMRDLKPGLSRDEITRNLGEPESTDFINGNYFSYYDNGQDPTILVFDRSGALIGWQLDRETIRDRENKRQHQQELDAQAEIARKNRLAAFGQSMQIPPSQAYMMPTSAPKSFSCRTSQVGNQSYTNCD